MHFSLLLSSLLAPLLVSALSTGVVAPPGPNPPPKIPKSDYEKIRYTLSLYPMAVDSKDFSAFSEIFTDDIHANYGPPLGELDGLPAIESTLQSILANVTTLHLFANSNILLSDNGTALAVTKAQASHFGKGVYAGQEYLIFGEYHDTFRRDGDLWKISQRVSFGVATFGNVSIFSGQ